MKKLRIKDRHGVERDEDGDYFLRDGEMLMVPLEFCDSAMPRPFRDSRNEVAGTRPGFLFRDDNSESELEREHRLYRERIAGAWRSDRYTKPPATSPPGHQQPTGGSVDEAYRQYNETVANRWRK